MEEDRGEFADKHWKATDGGVKCRLCDGIHEMLYSSFPVCTRCADDLKAIIKERRNSKK